MQQQQQAPTTFDFAKFYLLDLPPGTWFDSVVEGLTIQVLRKGLASFVLMRGDETLWLGNVQTTPLEVARAMSKKLLPKADVLVADAAQITLRRAFVDYQRFRALRPATLKNYKQRIEVNLREWLDFPLGEITRSMCLMRHHEIGTVRKRKSHANSIFKTLKAIYSFAINYYEDGSGNPVITHNPVDKLTHTRSWYRDYRRSRSFALELKPWLRAVMSLTNTNWRDFWLLSLFTGMRKSEALTLKWEQVCLKTGVICLKHTKNGDDRQIPLSDFLWELLKRRRYAARQSDKYVFQHKAGGTHLKEVHKSVMEVRRLSGVEFSHHDGRRTYASVADECEVKEEVVALLLGHRQTITGTYTIRSIERLKRAQQEITNGILRLAQQERRVEEVPYVITVVPS